VSHTVLTKKDWKDIKIDSVSLPLALRCWQTETRLAKMNRQSRPGRVGHANRAGNRASKAGGRQKAVRRNDRGQPNGRGSYERAACYSYYRRAI